jgi:hypothetical protein
MCLILAIGGGVQLLPQVRKNVDELQKEYDAVKELRTLEKKIEDLNDVLVWRYVIEKEAVCR